VDGGCNAASRASILASFAPLPLLVLPLLLPVAVAGLERKSCEVVAGPDAFGGPFSTAGGAESGLSKAAIEGSSAAGGEATCSCCCLLVDVVGPDSTSYCDAARFCFGSGRSESNELAGEVVVLIGLRYFEVESADMLET